MIDLNSGEQLEKERRLYDEKEKLGLPRPNFQTFWCLGLGDVGGGLLGGWLILAYVGYPTSFSHKMSQSLNMFELLSGRGLAG